MPFTSGDNLAPRAPARFLGAFGFKHQLTRGVAGLHPVRRVKRRQRPGVDDRGLAGDFHRVVQLVALSMVEPRETDTLKLAARDVPAEFRSLQEVVAKAKGRVLRAQLNEQDRQNIVAYLATQK